MKYYTTLLTLFAALSIGFAGCDTAENEPELERELDVQRVDPEADVEVLPSGEADVDLDPTLTE